MKNESDEIKDFYKNDTYKLSSRDGSYMMNKFIKKFL